LPRKDARFLVALSLAGIADRAELHRRHDPSTLPAALASDPKAALG
jgi:hypothetical protein